MPEGLPPTETELLSVFEDHLALERRPVTEHSRGLSG